MVDKKNGLDELKDILVFGINLGEGFAFAAEDKKVDWKDLAYFTNTLTSAPAAFVGAGEGIKKLSELTEAEKAEILEFVNSEFDIPQDKIELVVEKALSMALEIYGMIMLFLKKDEEPVAEVVE